VSTIKSSDEHLTLNADGSSKDIKFQANGVEKASISSAGVMTATSYAGSGANLTGVLPLAGGTMTGTLNVSESGNNAEIKVGTQTAHAHQGYSGVQFEDRGYIGGYPNDSLGIFYNTYHSSGSKAIETGTACNVQLLNGGIRFQTAASVSADAAQSLTDRLEITTDGRGLSQFTAKGWVQFDGSGTLSVKDSHNVSSVTDSSNGHYEINWSNNMANDDYSVSATSGHMESGDQTDSYSIISFRGSGIYTSKVEVQCIRARFDIQTMGDPKIVCLVAFGD